ncbi:hypothetical protein DW889_09105 [Bacteroides stercoris]|uniref:Uncharacterized protein n=1 Tax=Bacteroides stercoris TaxID=46506 RepID=A0A413V593_BACSE|nr:hypothetical protein DW889_09105 [Bacteroides stercoris]
MALHTISPLINIRFPHYKYTNPSRITCFYLYLFFVFQLRAVRLPIAGSSSRICKPDSPQLENEVFPIA